MVSLPVPVLISTCMAAAAAAAAVTAAVTAAATAVGGFDECVGVGVVWIECPAPIHAHTRLSARASCPPRVRGLEPVPVELPNLPERGGAYVTQLSYRACTNSELTLAPVQYLERKQRHYIHYVRDHPPPRPLKIKQPSHTRGEREPLGITNEDRPHNTSHPGEGCGGDTYIFGRGEGAMEGRGMRWMFLGHPTAKVCWVSASCRSSC